MPISKCCVLGFHNSYMPILNCRCCKQIGYIKATPFSAALLSDSLLDVSPEDGKYYKTASEFVSCRNESKKIRADQLNDDFCDCPDGSDKPGLYMIDEEGVIQTVDVKAKFVNGKPAVIEAKYVMRTPKDWDRFMERYSDAKGLQFVKK